MRVHVRWGSRALLIRPTAALCVQCKEHVCVIVCLIREFYFVFSFRQLTYESNPNRSRCCVCVCVCVSVSFCVCVCASQQNFTLSAPSDSYLMKEIQTDPAVVCVCVCVCPYLSVCVCVS